MDKKIKPHLLLNDTINLKEVKERWEALLACDLNKTDIFKILDNHQIKATHTWEDNTIPELDDYLALSGFERPSQKENNKKRFALESYEITKTELLKVEEGLLEKNQVDTKQESVLKNEEKKIKKEWIETSNVTRPTKLIPRKRNPTLYSNTHHADECLDIYYKETGSYPLKDELWNIILHSDQFETECRVVCHRFHVVIESNGEWKKTAFLDYYRRRLQ